MSQTITKPKRILGSLVMSLRVPTRPILFEHRVQLPEDISHASASGDCHPRHVLGFHWTTRLIARSWRFPYRLIGHGLQLHTRRFLRFEVGDFDRPKSTGPMTLVRLCE
jgi:hypothetical protein